MFELEVLNAIFRHEKRKIRSFPGGLPVSLDRNKLRDISMGYVWSVKVDGERNFLFVQVGVEKHHIFMEYWFVNRNMNVSDKYQKKILRHNSHQQNDESTSNNDENNSNDKNNNSNDDNNDSSNNNNSPIFLYVFDVEVCDNGNVFIFDVILYKNRPSVHMCYLQRLELGKLALKEWGVDTNDAWWYGISTSTTPTGLATYNLVCNAGKFQFWLKPVFDYCSLKNLWSILEKRIANDGIVFTRLLHSYTPFRNSMTAWIKWKPPRCITIDVRIKTKWFTPPAVVFGLPERFTTATSGNVLLGVTNEKSAGFTIFSDQSEIAKIDNDKNLQQHTPIAFGTVPEHILNQPEAIDGRIGEFFWHDRWLFSRLRNDKTYSNNMETIHATIANLEDVIEIEDLF